jgi:RNA polymerase sigma-70 factor (ECF subfamily)
MESTRVSGARKTLWTQLFAEHHVSLSGYFRRRVADRGDAEDLAQEVYLRLLRTDAGERREILNPEAYLYTIAVNLAREHAAARSRAPFSTDDIDRVAEVVADERLSEEALDRERRFRLLADAIEQLPPKNRAVLLMQYRDNLSYREIAERLQVSTHMVKKHVVKALALCRRGIAASE